MDAGLEQLKSFSDFWEGIFWASPPAPRVNFSLAGRKRLVCFWILFPPSDLQNVPIGRLEVSFARQWVFPTISDEAAEVLSASRVARRAEGIERIQMNPVTSL